MAVTPAIAQRKLNLRPGPQHDPLHPNKWDRRFLELAEHISTWSKDPSTKVGAVITDNERRVIGVGFNGFPRGVSDFSHRYSARELKYEMILHAEANALLNTLADTRNCTLYSTFFPCPQCAGLLIQKGIMRVVSTPHPVSDERWREKQQISKQMMQEAGVLFEV